MSHVVSLASEMKSIGPVVCGFRKNTCFRFTERSLEEEEDKGCQGPGHVQFLTEFARSRCREQKAKKTGKKDFQEP